MYISPSTKVKRKLAIIFGWFDECRMTSWLNRINTEILRLHLYITLQLFWKAALASLANTVQMSKKIIQCFMYKYNKHCISMAQLCGV